MYTSEGQSSEPVNPFLYNQQSQLFKAKVTWNDLCIKKEVLEAIYALGMHEPSEVQVRTIPKLLQGQNVVCQAKAGMGKTAVFVIAILSRMTLEVNREYLPHQCIVVAHTRELAYQIHNEFKRFGRFMSSPQLRLGCYFGGISIDKDMNQLIDARTTPHIIIGTPGRLLDLVYRGFINAANTKYFVVDQCDVTLSKLRHGMAQEIQQLHQHFDNRAQHILVSATISAEVMEIANNMATDWVDLRVDETTFDLSKLHYFYEILAENNKFKFLERMLDQVPFNQAIIFVNKVQKAKKLSQSLENILFNPITIHSDLPQHERLQCYDRFRANASRILVATDLFGRGMDIERVNMVVNYDFPLDEPTFLHRIGRAGRFDTSGIVVNFLKAEDNSQINQQKELERKFRLMIQRLPLNKADLREFLQE